MKKMFALLVAGVLFVASTMPAHAGFYEAAERASWANQLLAHTWLYTTVQMHYSDYYDYVDWTLIYNAWEFAAAAMYYAEEAWWNAPPGTATEWWAAEAFAVLTALENNMWLLFVSDGADPTYVTNSIVYAWLGQHTLSVAEQAAAGWF